MLRKKRKCIVRQPAGPAARVAVYAKSTLDRIKKERLIVS